MENWAKPRTRHTHVHGPLHGPKRVREVREKNGPYAMQTGSKLTNDGQETVPWQRKLVSWQKNAAVAAFFCHETSFRCHGTVSWPSLVSFDPVCIAYGPFFSRTSRTLFGPCKGPCTCVCLVRGFAQFSMARVQFRPRRPSASFSRVPVHGSV